MHGRTLYVSASLLQAYCYVEVAVLQLLAIHVLVCLNVRPGTDHPARQFFFGWANTPARHQVIYWLLPMKPTVTQQLGGTALFSIDKASHRVVEKGIDESKLGRWVWTRYRGKKTQTL